MRNVTKQCKTKFCKHHILMKFPCLFITYLFHLIKAMFIFFHVICLQQFFSFTSLICFKKLSSYCCFLDMASFLVILIIFPSCSYRKRIFWWCAPLSMIISFVSPSIYGTWRDVLFKTRRDISTFTFPHFIFATV